MEKRVIWAGGIAATPVIVITHDDEHVYILLKHWQVVKP
jgi:hypothetical protein